MNLLREYIRALLLEVVEEEPEEEYDYVSMTKADIVELAKKRGLPVSGTKKKIIARLEEND